MQRFNDATKDNLYNSIISGQYRTQYRITIGSTVITDDIRSMTTDAVLFDDFSIGNVISREIRVIIAGTTNYPNEIVMRPEIRVYDPVGIRYSDWLSKGVYYIADRTINERAGTIEFTGYCKLIDTDYVFFKTGTWVSQTALSVVNTIAADLGVQIHSDTTSLLTNSPKTIGSIPAMGENGTTAREMLSYIGVMYAGNWIIDDTGKLRLIALTDLPDETNHLVTHNGDAILITQGGGDVIIV